MRWKGWWIALAVACAGCARDRAPVAGNVDDDGQRSEIVPGPFPVQVTGTIGYSFPLEDGSGRIKLGLLEYDRAAIVVSAASYDEHGMDEEDAEVTLTVEPLASDQCRAEEQCLAGR